MLLSSRQTYFLLSYTHREGMNIPKVARMIFFKALYEWHGNCQASSQGTSNMGRVVPEKVEKRKSSSTFELSYEWSPDIIMSSSPIRELTRSCHTLNVIFPTIPTPIATPTNFHFPFKHDVTFLGLANRENILMLICINLFQVGALF